MGQTSPETPQAFSHFTHAESEGAVLVCDIQGCGDRLTDPQIISTRACDDYVVDLGQSAMRNFFSSHRCGELCRCMDLKHPFPSDLQAGEERAFGLIDGVFRGLKHVLFGFELAENMTAEQFAGSKAE